MFAAINHIFSLEVTTKKKKVKKDQNSDGNSGKKSKSDYRKKDNKDTLIPNKNTITNAQYPPNIESGKPGPKSSSRSIGKPSQTGNVMKAIGNRFL